MFTHQKRKTSIKRATEQRNKQNKVFSLKKQYAIKFIVNEIEKLPS